jgi:hypothetical protein
MNKITLASLTADIRVASKLRDGQHFTDAEIMRLANSSIYGFTRRLLSLPGADYFESQHSQNTISGTQSYAVATDCYEVKYVVIGRGASNTTGPWTKLKQRAVEDEQQAGSGLVDYTNDAPTFRLIGNKIYLYPIPTSVFTLVDFYIPLLPGLYTTSNTAIGAFTTSTDYMDDHWGFSDYIIYDVAVKITEGQDESTSGLKARRDENWEEVAAAVSARAQYSPKRLPKSKCWYGELNQPIVRRW